MDDEAFRAHLLDLTAALGRREHTPRDHAHALAYPWQRPRRSYLLADGALTRLDALDRAARDRILTAHAGPGGGRFPLLAFGSNAAPARLRLKLGHLPPPDRDLLVLAGDLHDFDVGVSAHPTLYGSLPATLFPSPGTAVRAAVLWVTAPQFLALTWSEITYRLGRLDGVRFAVDDLGAGRAPLTDLLAYVSRFGAFCPDGGGAPAALAAVPAAGRTAAALSQEQLLDAAARLALGPDARAEALVRLMFEDGATLVREVGPAIRAAGVPFASPCWTPYPGPDAAGVLAPGPGPG